MNMLIRSLRVLKIEGHPHIHSKWWQRVEQVCDTESLFVFYSNQLSLGGGRGPVFSGKGGVRPSYQVTDGYRVELPSYAYKGPLPPALRRKDTKKRMGFTW